MNLKNIPKQLKARQQTAKEVPEETAHVTAEDKTSSESELSDLEVCAVSSNILYVTLLYT